MISVLLVDDHELIRQGLRRAFEQAEGIQVVGEAGTVASALREYAMLQPDVVVIDVRLPDGNGHDLTKKLRGEREDVGLVVLTMYPGDEQLFNALDSGASAFVAKDSPAEQVVSAARHAAATPNSFSAADLAGAMRRRSEEPSGPQLSPREGEVLQLLVDGMSVSQISRRLYISESTTKTHISKIYTKLGAANRAQAVMAAVRSGLVKDTQES